MFSPTKRVCSFALKLSLCGPLSMETDFISTPKFTQKVCVSWCYATYGKIRIPARHPSIASLVIPTFHPNLIGLLPLCCQLEEMLSSRFFFFLLDSEALPPSFRYKTGGIEQNRYGFSISPGQNRCGMEKRGATEGQRAHKSASTGKGRGREKGISYFRPPEQSGNFYDSSEPNW